MKMSQEEFDNLLQRIRDNDPSLTELNLKYTVLSTVEAQRIAIVEAQRIAIALEKNQAVTDILISDSNIGDAGVQAIATVLEKNKTVKTIHLIKSNIGEVGAKILATLLEKNQTITKMYIGGNNFGDTGFQTIATALENNNTLTNLDLENANIGNVGAQCIATVLEKNKTLTEINLAGNNLGDVGVSLISASLGNNQTLTRFTLPKNNIGPLGAKSIGAALENNHTLTWIGIGTNNIGDEGSQSIAAALKINQTLKQIYMHGCNIGDAGAKSIATSLEKNQSIEIISLERNKITDEVAPFLAVSLEKNKTVTEISLGTNKIEDAGTKIIANSLKKNQTITHFNLSCNKISDVGAQNMADTLESNQTLKFVQLFGNNIGVKISETIDSLLQRNRALAKNKVTNPLPPEPTSSSSTTLHSLETQFTSANQWLERVEALEKTIAENKESQSSSSSSSQPDPETVQKAMDELERIDPKYKSSPEDVAEKSHIAANPSLAQYHQMAEKSFNESFLAAALISTNEFTTQTSNSVNMLGAFHELSSNFPFVSAVVSTMILAADTVSSAKKSGEFQNISHLNPNSNPTNAGNLSEQLARRLTISNESEINDTFNEVGKKDRLNGISDFLSEAKNIFKAASKQQVSRLDDNTARGLFGEELSPVQLLALDNAKSALEYVMHQDPAEIAATKSDINNDNQKAVIDRIVENAIGKTTLRVVASTVKEDKNKLTPPPTLSNNNQNNEDILSIVKDMQKALDEQKKSHEKEIANLKRQAELQDKELKTIKKSQQPQDEEDVSNVQLGNQMLVQAQKTSLSKSKNKTGISTQDSIHSVQHRLAKVDEHLSGPVVRSIENNSEAIEALEKTVGKLASQNNEKPSTSTKSPKVSKKENAECCIIF